MELADKTLREIVMDEAGAVDVFLKYGIDFYCRGDRNFEEACRQQNLDPQKVENEITERSGTSERLDFKLNDFKMSEIIGHIIKYHHAYQRSKKEPVSNLAERLAFEKRHLDPDLKKISDLVLLFFNEMENYIRREEQILFPVILTLADYEEHGKPKPMTCFGSVANPVAMMRLDHEHIVSHLMEIQCLTNNFALPVEDGEYLSDFYKDLTGIQHNALMQFYLENNILFPRALKLAKL